MHRLPRNLPRICMDRGGLPACFCRCRVGAGSSRMGEGQSPRTAAFFHSRPVRLEWTVDQNSSSLRVLGFRQALSRQDTPEGPLAPRVVIAQGVSSNTGASLTPQFLAARLRFFALVAKVGSVWLFPSSIRHNPRAFSYRVKLIGFEPAQELVLTARPAHRNVCRGSFAQSKMQSRIAA